MIAPSRRIPRIDTTEPHATRLGNAQAHNAWADAAARVPKGQVDLIGARFMPWLITLLGFIGFIPYPAVRIGASTGLQVGNLLVLAMIVPLFVMSFRRPPLKLGILIAIPVVLSCVKVVFGGEDNVDLALKTVPIWVVHIVTLIVAQVYAPRYTLALLRGIALAVLLHVGLGAIQMWYFRSQQFPFAWMYVNPMFLSVIDTQERIAKYIQRPFGLFPEPSAMSSSLAPFVLLWIGQLCGLVRFREPMSQFTRRLFAAAAIGGLALIIASQSGHAAITLMAAGVFLTIWFLRSKATMRTFAAILCVFGIAMPLVLWAAVESLSSRVNGAAGKGSAAKMSNGSWDERSGSLVSGFWLWIDGGPSTVIFGIGSGMSAEAIERKDHVGAVFSVSLVFIYETGLVGLIAVGLMGNELRKAYLRSRRDPAFLIVGGVWLLGITLTTSYATLMPIWLTLGWLDVWPKIIDRRPRARRSALREPIAPAVARRAPWIVE